MTPEEAVAFYEPDEDAGALFAKYDAAPKSVTVTPDGSFREMVALTGELGLYGIPPAACMLHLRMAPCRKPEPHVYSTDPEDVARAAAFAAGR